MGEALIVRSSKIRISCASILYCSGRKYHSNTPTSLKCSVCMCDL